MKKLNILSLLIASTLWCGSLDTAADEDSAVQFEGISSFRLRVALTATENAPDATGKANLKFENDHGQAGGVLELETRGVPRPFVVSLVKASDGAVLVLDGIETAFDLPADLDPRDLGQIVVADPAGLPLLVTDLGNSTQLSMRFQSLVNVTAGPAAPAAEGIAHLQASARDGNSAGQFALIAQNLTPGCRYSIRVDGNDIAMITSPSSGVIQLRTLFGTDLFTVHLVELFDAAGNLALAAHF